MRCKRIGLAGLVLLVVVVVGVLASCGSAVMSRDVGSVEAPAESVVVEREPVAYTGNDTAASEHSQAEVEQMIIWNANISLTVDDVRAAMGQVQALARELGGRTIGSESWLDGEQLHARLTIRVPSGVFEDAMARLRDLAVEVHRESANSEDVTDQYVDLQSRLRHLEAKEAQLLEFLDAAEDTEATLAVYDHLAETQGEIEQVKGRMEYLKNLSAMATIDVDLYPEEADLPVIEEGWKPGIVVRDAARALINTLEGLAGAAIWIGIYLLPILLLIGVPIVVIVWGIRRRRRLRREREVPQE